MGGRRSLFRWRVFATDRSTLSQMSAARAVLSGPDSLSNNSPRTCASTCGHASLAATNNSSSIAIGSPSGTWLPPSSSTHSPYGSGLSLEPIGFISGSAELGSTKACHWVASYVNSTGHNYRKRPAEDVVMRYSVLTYWSAGSWAVGARSSVVKCRTPDSSVKKLCLPFLPYLWGRAMTV